MNDQRDSPEAPVVEQNGPETNEYVAPAPFIWQPWQVEILEKNLGSYKAIKSVRGRLSILGKVLTKFTSRIAVSDNDLGDLRKVCNQSSQSWMGLKTGNRQRKNGSAKSPEFERQRNLRFEA
jgi:hypothetical protein